MGIRVSLAFESCVDLAKEESSDQEVEQCCVALSERLDNQQFFFNEKPTELDALVFGHLFSILTTPLPDTRLASIVRQHKNLVELCQTIDKEYFDRLTSSKSSDNFEKL